MKIDYIFTLAHFVLVVTFRHSGRSFEPESSDLCYLNMSLKIITSLLSIACSGLICRYFCESLQVRPWKLCDFIPEIEARSRIYTQLFTSSIWVSLVESVTRKCPFMCYKP